jgi:uncharacterized protein YcgI (DUF1989 family)
MSVQQAPVTVIPPRSGTAFMLEAGAELAVIDLEGGQVADLLAFAADDPREVLSNGRTFDYEETVRLTSGNRLWSNRSRPLLTIVSDASATHDFLLTPCSRETWQICYGGDHDDVPGCFGNLAAALAPYGVAPDAIPTAFNVFMDVPLAANGRLIVRAPRNPAGTTTVFRAEQRLIIGLTACSAKSSNGGTYKPIGYSVLQP